MATRPTRGSANAANRPAVPPVAIAVAVIVLALFIAWRAYVAFVPQVVVSPPASALAQQEKDMQFVRQKAREVQGDFTKLSPQDQQKVQQLTHGFGVAAIASSWRKESAGH